MKKYSVNNIRSLLDDARIRREEIDGEARYASADLIEVLHDREPNQSIGETAWLDLEGVLRLVQSTSTPRAQRIKNCLIANAIQRLEEADDPELALVRTRHDYEQQGYSRQWIDQRMRCVSARHELTSQWYRRGARDSEEFRALTNAMMQAAFGMDVEAYRRFKELFGTRHNLRDHMTRLELSLTSLVETAAAEMHRQRDSVGFDALLGGGSHRRSDAPSTVAQARDAGRHIGESPAEPATADASWSARGGVGIIFRGREISSSRARLRTGPRGESARR